ncbi:MAG: hypothetical protein IKC12_02925 [Alistipes sp.]|nr:hypothetical protein [Alistipes sp.]
MKTLRNTMAVLFAAILALSLSSCEKNPDVDKGNDTPKVETPTITIEEPKFDADAMTVKVNIKPSADATAWYWQVIHSIDNEYKPLTKVEGSTAMEVEFAAMYGVEYTIMAYAENEAGKSQTATKKFCAMPEGEVAITIGDIVLNEATMMAEVTIYPSDVVKTWYWRSYTTDADTATLEWNSVEGNAEKSISFAYEWGKSYELSVYAECDALTSDVVTKQCLFEPSVPTLRVGKAEFDAEQMTVSFKVTPSEDTHHWYWGLYDDALDAKYEIFEGSEAKTVSYKVEYDKEYSFIFRVENALNKGNEEIVDFFVLGDVADITISNLTAFTVDAHVAMSESCVRYVAGAVHTSAYDRNTFIEQAQTALNPDPSYPFAAFNTATEDRTFTEQDLVHNARTDSKESAGLMLLSGVSYTIAVYGENADGKYNVETLEFVVPEAEINGSVAIDMEMTDISDNAATVKVTAAEACKMVIGYIDPAIAKSDMDNPFDFEGKSDEEIKAYIISVVQAIPMVYNEPITHMLSDRLEVGSTYYAYAIAIKDDKVGEVEYTQFKTTRPTLSGIAKITAAEIEAQTSHETLTVKVTADSNAAKVRLYAAPSTDHAAYADNMEGVMDADEYQNYREEYELVNGVATAIIDIYHPGDKYYIYASAVDAEGLAGEMVCVAQLAGYDTEYYTTMEEVVDDGTLSYDGTGTARLTASEESTNVVDNETRVSVTLTAINFSANVDKVWFMRLASCLTSDIESRVQANLEDYAETNRPKGSYKSVTEGWAYQYIDDTTNSFNPKYEALLSYDSNYGGDLIVMVILDTDGKVNIHSYYGGGLGVVEM